MKYQTQQLNKCSKLTIEALEQGVKYVQSYNKSTRTTPINIFKVNNKDTWCLLSEVFSEVKRNQLIKGFGQNFEQNSDLYN